MFSVEIAWFEFDLPDHATITAETASPNPLFPDARVTTRWIVALDRYELTINLSATQDLSDFSRAAFDTAEKGLTVQPFNQAGIPAMRHGAYERDRTRIDWAFHLQGITLSFTLMSKGFARTLPTQGERAEHDAIIASVRQVNTQA
jgi:hypothetical protein